MVIKNYSTNYKNLMKKKYKRLMFSIITVSLNQPKIVNNFKSLRSQTYKNFEHIVIDGGSNDETLDIIKKNSKNISFLFGTVRKDRVLHGFWPNKISWKFNIYPSHSGGFFITRKAQKKVGNYSLKFKYSSDRDLIYRMIVRYKLNGCCTKKNEILSKFAS